MPWACTQAYDTIFWYDIDFEEATMDNAGRLGTRSQDELPLSVSPNPYRLNPGRLDYDNTGRVPVLNCRPLVTS